MRTSLQSECITEAGGAQALTTSAGEGPECPVCDGSGKWASQFGWDYCPLISQLPSAHFSGRVI